MKVKQTKKTVVQQEKISVPVPSVDSNAPLKIEEIEKGQENEPREKSNRSLFIMGGIFLALVISGAMGFIFFLSNQFGKESAIVPVTQEIQTSPSPVPPVLVRSEWTFEILNGSGVAGAAGKAADKLEALGYKVISIDNADKQTYKGNGLFVRQEMMNKVDLVVADLKDTIAIATVAGVLKDSTASARLIIGKE